MQLKLVAVKFEDYRNIANGQILELQNITSLLGANEAGKSNVLRAIACLEESLTVLDTKIGTTRKTEHKPPVLTYYFDVAGGYARKVIGRYIKNLHEHDFVCLQKEGEQVTISICDHKKHRKVLSARTFWRNVSDSTLVFSNNNEDLELEPGGVIAGYFSGLQVGRYSKQGFLERVAEEEVIGFLDAKIKQLIPDVEEWSYDSSSEDEADYYLPNEIPWEEFVNNPDLNEPCHRIFKIAAIEEPAELSDFQEKLSTLKGDDSEIQNFLDSVALAVNNVIEKTWNQGTLQLGLTYQTDKLRIDTFEGDKKKRKPPDVRSEGVKWFIAFLMDFQSRGRLDDIIILFDQPGERLHPGGQKELRERFESLSNSCQIVYATQSPFLVDRNNWQKVQFLRKEQIGETRIFVPSMENVRNDELLRASLGYTLADVGQANDLNIVVEGYYDTYILKSWANIVNEKRIGEGNEPILDMNRYAIIDSHGSSTIYKSIMTLNECQLIAIGVYDGDRQGMSSLKQAKRNKKLRSNFFSISELVEDETIQTAEDLVPELVMKSAIKSCFPEVDVDTCLMHPRMDKINETFMDVYARQFTREIKEQIWEQIFELCDNDDNAFNNTDEHLFAEEVLQACVNRINELDAI